MTDRIDIVALDRMDHQVAHARMLADGLARHGIATRIVGQPAECRTPVVACWGWRVGEVLRNNGHDVLVMERAYLGDRFRWISLGWNGLNGRARFPAQQDGGKRLDRHFPRLLEPWRDADGYALLIGQVPGDMSLAGRDLSGWYADAAALLRMRGYDVFFRPHPQAVSRGLAHGAPKGVPIQAGDLTAALETTEVAITFNSNTGVLAACAGVPVIAIDEGSMAYGVAAHALDAEIVRPDRPTWAARLAWCQWLPEEIADGSAWEAVATCL